MEAASVASRDGHGGPQRRRRSPTAQGERRLGWMLCAPAVIAMLLVTAYPIGYAIVLSLQELDLRFPEEGGFAGLDNYRPCSPPSSGGRTSSTPCSSP